MARPDRAEHRPRCPARGPRRGTGHLLRGLRPDRAEPAPRAPGPGAHRAPAAAGRAPAAGAGRRVDRADRRPPAERRADAEHQGDRRVLGAEHPGPDRAVPVLRGRQRRGDGEQPGLDRADVGDRLPARRRQALPGQQDDHQGRGGGPAELRAGHLLHRVQLPAAAGPGLPRAVPPARLHAAVRRQRPVGQPHRRAGPDPPGRAARRCTPSRPRCSPRPTAPSSARPRAGRSGSTPSSPRRTRSSSSGSTPTTRTSSRCLKVLSFRSRDEIEALEKAVAERPQAREAQRALAEELTGAGARRGRAGRGGRRPARRCSAGASWPGWTAARWRPRSPSCRRPRSTSRPTGWPLLVDLFAATGLAPSRSAARRAVAEGGAYLNNARVDRPGGDGRRPTTCSPASGWCCGAASGTWPRSGSAGRCAGLTRAVTGRARR